MERESPPREQRLSTGAPPPGRRQAVRPPRLHLLLRLSRREKSSGAFFLVSRVGAGRTRPRGRGRGCPVPAAAASGPPPRSGWCVDAQRGLSLPLPRGPPTSFVLSPPGTLRPGLEGCATRCPGPILLKPLLPQRAWGGRWQPREELLPSVGSAVPLVGAEFARRRDLPRPPLPGRTRGEQRKHSGSRRSLA